MDALLALHSKYSLLVEKTFKRDAAFEAALDKVSDRILHLPRIQRVQAFRTIVNDTATNPNINSPELIAKYCDQLLKKNPKSGIQENEIEDILASVV